MAATLGSVMAGEIALLVQLGFALALGMLIDTFIVRPCCCRLHRPERAHAEEGGEVHPVGRRS